MIRMLRRVAIITTGVLVSACGALLGIDTELDVKPSDAAVPVPDAEAGKDAGVDVARDVETGALPPQRPPEGIYVYEVTGYDEVRTPFGSPKQNYGPTASIAIVYAGADCFEMTFTFRATYKEMLRMCVVGLDYVQSKGTRDQQFAVGSAQTTTTCIPGNVYYTTAPNPVERIHDCSGDNTDTQSAPSKFRVVGPYRFIADQNIDIKGQLTATRHFKSDGAVSGSQNGTNVADWFFSPIDGAVVRFNRKIDIDYQSPIGKVTYLEEVNMTLVLRPGAIPDGGTD